MAVVIRIVTNIAFVQNEELLFLFIMKFNHWYIIKDWYRDIVKSE